MKEVGGAGLGDDGVLVTYPLLGLVQQSEISVQEPYPAGC